MHIGDLSAFGGSRQQAGRVDKKMQLTARFASAMLFLNRIVKDVLPYVGSRLILFILHFYHQAML